MKLHRFVHRFAAASVLAVCGALGLTAVAQATVTSSEITSPASGYLESLGTATSSTPLTVTGTSNGTTGDEVDIDCWYGTNDDNYTFANGVAVQPDGSFTATGPLSNIAGNDCRLRAEPSGDSTESTAFTGPVLGVSEFLTGAGSLAIAGGPNNGKADDYYAAGTTSAAYAGWDSAGDCGPYAIPMDANFDDPSYAINCVGSLYDGNDFNRSEILVDGHNAYNVASAYNLFDRTGSCTVTSPPFPAGCDGSQDNSGFPTLTVSQSWNPSNGLMSTQTTEGIVECTGSDGYEPADQAACPAFQPSGVQLSRSTTMIEGGRSQVMTDTWSSTDGHAHTLDLLYDDFSGNGGSPAGFEFPGQTSFSQYDKSDTLPGSPAAPGTIFVKSEINAPDGDTTNTVGAITFSSAPSGYLFNSPSELEEDQLLSVPATGSVQLTYVYSEGFTLASVASLAYAAEDLIKSPHVAITSPGNGSRSGTGTVTVSGTATAGSGVTALTVDGHAVSVAANGGWSTSVALKVGENAISATAADHAGGTASAQVTVAYGCIVPKTKGLKPAAAKKRLKKAYCTIGKTIKIHSRTKKGRVLGTRPGKGSKKRAGVKIKLVVSEGPKKRHH